MRLPRPVGLLAEQVGVGVQGEARIGVTQPGGNFDRAEPGGDQQAGVEVPQVVEPDAEFQDSTGGLERSAVEVLVPVPAAETGGVQPPEQVVVGTQDRGVRSEAGAQPGV